MSQTENEEICFEEDFETARCECCKEDFLIDKMYKINDSFYCRDFNCRRLGEVDEAFNIISGLIWELPDESATKATEMLKAIWDIRLELLLLRLNSHRQEAVQRALEVMKAYVPEAAVRKAAQRIEAFLGTTPDQ